MDSLAFLDAHDQAELVRKGDLTPLELVDAAIARIERLNPKVNAVVAETFDTARAAAANPSLAGPFAGVPTLIKDMGAAMMGVRNTSGSAFLKEFVPNFESLLVTRLKAAGFILLGRSNAPEFGLLPTTEPSLHGPCRNPWDPQRSTGGSSGGAAAAVASGMVPVAQAGDGGGSLRIPASACGLFGLKPTRGRISFAPMVEGNGLGVFHAITRSVRDSAALLDIMGGPAPGDPWPAPPPLRPFRHEVGADPDRLRIAFTTRVPDGTPVHPDAIRAVEETARLCADLGHSVVEGSPTFDMELLTRAFITVWFSKCASAIDGSALLTGRTPTADQFEPVTWAMAEQGRTVSASQLQRAQMDLQLISRYVGAFFTGYDLWLSPTLTEPPLPLGSFDPLPENPLAGFLRAISYTPFTPIANVTGQPAMSVPLHWNEAGLPIGVHFMGRYGDEATLFRLAAQLESARPWAGRIPPIHA